MSREAHSAVLIAPRVRKFRGALVKQKPWVECPTPTSCSPGVLLRPREPDQKADEESWEDLGGRRKGAGGVVVW